MILTGLGVAIWLAGAAAASQAIADSVRGVAPRPGHVSRRGSAAGRRVDDRVRSAGLACGGVDPAIPFRAE